MGDFETLKPEERRDKYDEILGSELKEEPNMIVLYTIWKPNALDGMDEKYIGRAGSSPTGQYAMAWGKETGSTIKRQSNDIENVMEHITGPNKYKDFISEPTLRTINGVDKYTLRIVVPITNNKTNDEVVVGAVGCVLSIDAMQNIVENTLKNNDEINMLIIYSSKGSIIAHYKPEYIGKNMFDVDEELGNFRNDIYNAMNNNEICKGSIYEPNINDNIRFVAKPDSNRQC